MNKFEVTCVRTARECHVGLQEGLAIRYCQLGFRMVPSRVVPNKYNMKMHLVLIRILLPTISNTKNNTPLNTQ